MVLSGLNVAGLLIKEERPGIEALSLLLLAELGDDLGLCTGDLSCHGQLGDCMHKRAELPHGGHRGVDVAARVGCVLDVYNGLLVRLQRLARGLRVDTVTARVAEATDALVPNLVRAKLRYLGDEAFGSGGWLTGPLTTANSLLLLGETRRPLARVLLLELQHDCTHTPHEEGVAHVLGKVEPVLIQVPRKCFLDSALVVALGRTST